MAKVMINCPVTNKPVFTGIVLDKQSFESTTLENNTFAPCPECGKSHTWNKKDAFLEEEN